MWKGVREREGEEARKRKRLLFCSYATYNLVEILVGIDTSPCV